MSIYVRDRLIWRFVSRLAMPLLLACGLHGATYYVDSVHGDDNTFGLVIPWKTLARASRQTYKPGDRLLLKSGDVWDETLTISSSGTASKPITVGSYGSGAAPLLDEQGVRWPALNLTGVSYIKVTGLAMQNASDITVTVHNSANVTIQQCSFHNSASHVISVDGVSPNVMLTGNTYTMDSGFIMQGTFIVANSVVESFTASGNTATLNDDATNNGIITFDIDNAVIANNTIYNGTEAIGAKAYTRSVSGIQIYGNAVYNTSKVHGDGESIELSGVAAGDLQISAAVHDNFVSGGPNTLNGIPGVYSSSSSVYNNIVLCPALNTGIHMTSYSANVNIYGNDIYGYPYGILLDSGSSASIVNNIIVNATSRAIAVGAAAQATEDYNLFYQSGPNAGLAAGSHTVLQENPMFASAAPAGPNDFKLQAASPAADTGEQLVPPYDQALDPKFSTWPPHTVSQNKLGGWSRGAFGYR
jgi:hypothetical protein